VKPDLAIEGCHSFAHANETEAAAGIHVGRHAMPVIPDIEVKNPAVRRCVHFDPDLRSIGVSRHIGERLLNQSENRDGRGIVDGK
jgi:hypothetical protein